MRPPCCALGIAAAVFSWIGRNHWRWHRGSGKAVDIRASGKGWRHRAWCSGSSAARVKTKPQCQLALSRATGQALALLQCPCPLSFSFHPDSQKPTSPAQPALCLYNPWAPPVRSLRRWPCPHHIVLGPVAPIHLPTMQHTNGEPSRTLCRCKEVNGKESVNKKKISGSGLSSPFPPFLPESITHFPSLYLQVLLGGQVSGPQGNQSVTGPHWAVLPHWALGSSQGTPLDTGASQMATQSAVAPAAHADWAPRNCREHNAALDPHCGHTSISIMMSSCPQHPDDPMI